MTCTRKLLLTIPALGAGGAERVMTTLANHWTSKGWDITLLTYEKAGVEPFYELNSKVKLVQIDALSLNKYKLFWDVLKRVFKIRQFIKKAKPDVVLSFSSANNIVTLWAKMGTGVSTIVSERIDPTAHDISVIKKIVRDWMYRFADKVVVQTLRIQRSLPKHSRKQSVVIPNPLILTGLKADYKKKTVVAAGRLVEQKGFDILVKSFATISSDWNLVIWGEGPERERLNKLINLLKLQDRVTLPGITKDLSQAMIDGSIFVLSSRFEGMPNALAEAMSLGLSVIATDCPTGPRELIENEEDGFLVPVDDIEALAQAMQRLMQDEKMRAGLGQVAAKKMKAYDIISIAGVWEKAFNEVGA